MPVRIFTNKNDLEAKLDLASGGDIMNIAIPYRFHDVLPQPPKVKGGHKLKINQQLLDITFISLNDQYLFLRN